MTGTMADISKTSLTRAYRAAGPRKHWRLWLVTYRNEAGEPVTRRISADAEQSARDVLAIMTGCSQEQIDNVEEVRSGRVL